MAFRYYGTLDSNQGQMIIGGNSGSFQTIIDNSDVITIGDVVNLNTDGHVEEADATEAVLGIVTDILRDGKRIRDEGSEDTYTTESDNETDKKAYVMVDVSKNTIWSAAQDGTVNGTNNSGKMGAYIDIADEGQLSESSATRTRATSGQFTSVGTDQEDSTRILVVINESILETGV